jgi:hypothetical protein
MNMFKYKYSSLLLLIIITGSLIQAANSEWGIKLYIPYNNLNSFKMDNYNLTLNSSYFSYYPLPQQFSIGYGFFYNRNELISFGVNHEIWNINIGFKDIGHDAASYNRLDNSIWSLFINYNLFSLNNKLSIVSTGNINYSKGIVGNYGLGGRKLFFDHQVITYDNSLGFSYGMGLQYIINNNLKLGLNIINTNHKLSDGKTESVILKKIVSSNITLNRFSVIFIMYFRIFPFDHKI